MANQLLWVFLLGPAPFVLLLFALETKRKSGWGICGSSLFDLLFAFCDLICHFMVSANCAVYRFFTAYVIIRTVPQSIYGQTREKKKCPVGYCERLAGPSMLG